jgi:hypothetical protein
MTTDQVLAICKKRGLTFGLSQEGDRPVLKGASNNPEVTDALMRVLRWHRDNILERLKKGKVL